MRKRKISKVNIVCSFADCEAKILEQIQKIRIQTIIEIAAAVYVNKAKDGIETIIA